MMRKRGERRVGVHPTEDDRFFYLLLAGSFHGWITKIVIGKDFPTPTIEELEEAYIRFTSEYDQSQPTSDSTRDPLHDAYLEAIMSLWRLIAIHGSESHDEPPDYLALMEEDANSPD